MSRKPKGDLVAWWMDGDVHYAFPAKADGHLLHSVLCAGRLVAGPATGPEDVGSLCGMHSHVQSFVKELEARGYDLRTLRFSVDRKKDGEAAGA